MTETSDKACPGCRGSGRVRRMDLLAGTSESLACDVCRGSGRVQGHVQCQEVRYHGTAVVLNPGDPGYAEKKLEIEEREHEARH